MRFSLALLTALIASHAYSQSVTVKFLSEQLATAKDPRSRVQAALNLAALKEPASVAPLCNALKDPEVIVRTAAASALGELKELSAISCLTARKDQDTDVRLAVAKAIEALERRVLQVGSLYIQVDPIKDETGNLSADDVKMAEGLLREKLLKMGASLAPLAEDRASAISLVRKMKLKGYLLKPKFHPHQGDRGLRLNLLVLTYPDQVLKGTYNVKGSGPKPALLKQMIPKAVDDAAADLEWQP